MSDLSPVEPADEQEDPTKQRDLKQEEYLLALLSGDETMWIGFATDYYAPLMRYIFRRVPNEMTAEDICQNAMVNMLTALPEFTWNGERRFRGWLFRIAYRCILDYCRQLLKENGLFIDEDDDVLEKHSTTYTTEEIVLRNEFKQEIKNVLRKQPHHHQIVITLLQCGYSQKEAEAEAGLSRGSAGIILKRYLIKVVNHLIEKGLIDPNLKSHDGDNHD